MKMAVSIVAILALSSSVTTARGVFIRFWHQGPVTDITTVGDYSISCSQRGLERKAPSGSIREFPSPPFRIVSIADHPSGLLVVGGYPGESGSFAIMNSETGATITDRQIADDLVYSVAVSGKVGFFALADGRILEIDVENFAAQSKLRHEHTAPARSVRISPSNRFLASAGMDRLVIISDLEQRSDRVAIQDHTGPVDCLAFSPDSTQIASGARDGKVRIHAVPGGKLLRTHSNLDGEVGAIAWGGKPERLLAGTTRGLIYQLDLDNDSAVVIDNWGSESPITALAIDSKGNAFAGTLNRVNPVKPVN